MCKRISFLNLCNWIENCEIKTFKFIGSYHDFVLTEEVINKLRIKYKDYNFINLCGEYDLEQTYSLIYNCKSLLSTESFSGFLSSLGA